MKSYILKIVWTTLETINTAFFILNNIAMLVTYFDSLVILLDIS